MKFEYYNPNPDAKTFKSGKPKSWNRQDDVVRAICKVTNKTWNDVYQELFDISNKMHDMINSKNVIDTYIKTFNGKFFTLGKPKVGEKRPTIEEFVNMNKTGKYILYLRDYYVTVIDGVLYNTINLNDEAVYSYWEI